MVPEREVDVTLDGSVHVSREPNAVPAVLRRRGAGRGWYFLAKFSGSLLCPTRAMIFARPSGVRAVRDLSLSRISRRDAAKVLFDRTGNTAHRAAHDETR